MVTDRIKFANQLIFKVRKLSQIMSGGGAVGGGYAV